jgi:hypothetical protein
MKKRRIKLRNSVKYLNLSAEDLLELDDNLGVFDVFE